MERAMPDPDVLQVLFDARDLGVGAFDAARATELVRVAVAREREHERGHRSARRSPGRGVARRLRFGGRLLVPAATVTVSLLIAVVAIVALDHGGASTPASTASPPGARALIARLAVLRRPQTAADRLPRAAIKSLDAVWGPVVPSLARLVARIDGERIDLVVSKPPRAGFWTRFGDQVSLIAVRDGRYLTGCCGGFPAASLDNPGGLERLGPNPVTLRTPLFEIVPDGVARVEWTFSRKGRDVVWLRPHDNIVGPYSRGEMWRPSVRWFAADGRPIRLSTALEQRADRIDRAARRAQAIRAAEHSRYRPPASLLRAFTVFSITSRTPVRLPGDVLVSNPRLQNLPLVIVGMALNNRNELDLRDARAIVTPGRARLFLLPGQHGLCLFRLERDGAGGTCSGSVTAVEHRGMSSWGGAPGGPTIWVGVVPGNQHTVTVGLSRKRVVHPVDGVYSVAVGRNPMR